MQLLVHATSQVVRVLAGAEPWPSPHATQAPPASFVPAGQLVQLDAPAAEHVWQLAWQSVTTHDTLLVPAALPVPVSHMVHVVSVSL